MTDGIKTIMYPVTDLARTLYSRLVGVEAYMNEPYYLGFNVQCKDVGLDPHGHDKGLTGPVGCWHVDDIEESLQALLDAGAQAQQEVRDIGGSKSLASVKDADGNVIGLLQAP